MAHNRVFFLQDSLRTVSNPQMTAPPPPPPSSPSSSTSSSTSFPILAISILGILTTAILLVSYYVFVIKCCLNWRHTDIFGRLSSAAGGAYHHRTRSRSRRRGGALDDAFFATYSVYAPSASPARGLEEWVIRAIPIVWFKRSTSTCSSSGSLCECAVCLGEFQDGEGLRQLPECSHVFHIDCIDVWLQNSANCPLCRSNISAAAPQQLHLFPPIHHSLTHFPSPVQDHNGDVVIDFGARSGAEPDNPAAAPPTTPPSTPPPPPAEHQHGGPIRPPPQKKGGHGKLHHVSSMGDECLDARPWRKGGDLERFALSPVQPIRRSISMDSSTDHHLYVAVQEILRQQRLQQGDSSGEGTSSAASAAVGGGSGRIRRSFFSFGHCRSSRSAVLPVQCDP